MMSTPGTPRPTAARSGTRFPRELDRLPRAPLRGQELDRAHRELPLLEQSDHHAPHRPTRPDHGNALHGSPLRRRTHAASWANKNGPPSGPMFYPTAYGMARSVAKAGWPLRRGSGADSIRFSSESTPMDRKPRRLGMGDLMILIAAAPGLWGCGAAQPLAWAGTDGPPWQSYWLVTPGGLVVAAFLAALAGPMTLACLALRLRQPRPTWRRIWVQPGAAACLACALMFALRAPGRRS